MYTKLYSFKSCNNIFGCTFRSPRKAVSNDGDGNFDNMRFVTAVTDLEHGRCGGLTQAVVGARRWGRGGERVRKVQNNT